MSAYAGEPETGKVVVFKEHLGKVLVVEVAMIGCGLSRKYMLKLKELYPGLKKLGAEVLKVDVNAEKELKNKPELPYENYGDPGGVIAKKLGVRLLPTMVLIDKFGNVRFRGSMKDLDLMETVKKLAAETEPPADISTGPAFKPGDAAPVFTAKTIDGDDFDLKKTAAENKFTVLFFHSLMCPFSKKAVELFELMAVECVDGDGIRMAIVTLEDDVKAIKEKLQENMGDDSIAIIPDKDKKIKNLYKVEGAPFGAIIGKDGKIVFYGDFDSLKFREILGIDSDEADEDAFEDMSAFKGKTVEGKEFDSAEYVKKQKATVFMFVTSADELDQMSMEELFGWLKKMKFEGVSVVAIEEGEDIEAAKKFYEEKKYDVNLVHDADGKIAEKCGVEETPYLYLVSPDGKIACWGELETEEWEYFVKLLVEGKPLKPRVEESPEWG
jgi:peroxiredoxin